MARSRATPPRASVSPKARAKSAPAESVKPASSAEAARKPAPANEAKKQAAGAKQKPARPAEPQASEAPKAAAPKKKAATSKNKPSGKTRAPATAVRSAPVEGQTPTAPTALETTPPTGVSPATEAEMGLAAEPATPSAPVVHTAPEAPMPGREERLHPRTQEAEVLAVESALLEQEAAQAGMEETRRGIEEVLSEPVPEGPVDVPGFETEQAPSETEATPEVEPVLDGPKTLDTTGPSDLFFTATSPGAEPPRMRTRMSGLLSLARQIAFQTLASERVSRTVVSARGMVDAALTSLGLGGSTSVDEYGKDAALGGVLQPVVDFLYEHYWRVSVQGASHVPTGPVLLVANHSGALPFDGPMLQQALSRERPDLQEARWLAEDQVFHAPMMGTLMNRLGAVRACPENALRLLDELRPVIVFPEGSQGMGKPFAQRYQLKRFGRGGFVKLALRTGAPIVPVAIVGAEETVPLLGKLPAGFLGLDYLPVTLPPLPARWTLRFGEPISMGDLPPEAAEDLSQVQRLTERTRESIQGMLQALLKERRSVFSG
ncbi:acyltransferase family protein [Cystobacter fuscus]|uniref:Acyltransferase family protein n=1 Tax=Cystobacter fuscus TaxID=43 RepID=A0A250J5R7_9BACT|nr:lysophospholipid acyltransferase family protein [Cystobacter fuscus]ATB38812.1 acyltransferase family protein [Cystobacter fuscus]